MARRKSTRKHSPVPSIFGEEIDQFNAEFRLSRRESDIVSSLFKNVTNSEQIAKSLGISTHTVNNHLKSIFEKTGTKSKTEILSIFLRFAADRMQTRSLFLRKPRVLVIDDEELTCEFIAEGLGERGMKAYSLTDPDNIVDTVSTLNIDFIVCDARMPSVNGMSLLKELRSTYRCWPYFIFVTGHPDYTLEECLHSGAAGYVEKPVDLDRLFRMIMEHLVDSDEKRSQLLQLQNTKAVSLAGTTTVSAENIGCGGAFLPMDRQTQSSKGIEVGTLVEAKIKPDNAAHTLKVKGQVVWVRSDSEDGRRPVGIGIKFVEVSDRDEKFLEDYIRSNDILSFIPLGTPQSVLSAAPA